MKTFEKVNVPQLNFELDSRTGESGRVYVTPDGKSYPSITTVLSGYNKEGLLKWRKRVGEEEANRVSRVASARGSKLHSVCESYLLNEMTDKIRMTMMPDTKGMFIKMQQVMDAHIGRVYAIEQPLYSHRLKIAGRVDCIAEWDGILSIIDWKTASRSKEENYIRNYFMQCTGYAEMYEDVTNSPIEQIVVVIAVADDEPQVFVKSKHDYLEDLQKEIDNYHNKTLNGVQ